MKLSILQVISTALLLEAAALPKEITDPTTAALVAVETLSAPLSSITIVVAVTPSPPSSADTIVSVETPSTPSSTGTTVAVETSSAPSLTGTIVPDTTPSAPSSVETPSAPPSTTATVAANASAGPPPSTITVTTTETPLPSPTTIYSTLGKSAVPPKPYSTPREVIDPSDPRWLTDYAGKPTYMCRYEGYALYNAYHLTGTNWNTTEEEIKKLCSKSDILKEWHWQESNNTSGMQSFWAEFYLPLHTANRLENNLNNHLKPWAYVFRDLKKIKCSGKYWDIYTPGKEGKMGAFKKYTGPP